MPLADNFVINGTNVANGINVALENLGGDIFAQRIKLIKGAIHIDGGDVSPTNPLDVQIAMPTLITGLLTITGVATNQVVATPTIGKLIRVVRLSVATDTDNTAKLTFRIGCGTTTTPVTLGVIASHPGMGNNTLFTWGDGFGTLGGGIVNDPLRLTGTDPLGSYDLIYEYFEA